MKWRSIVFALLLVLGAVAFFHSPFALSSNSPSALKIICLPARPLSLAVAWEQGLLAKRGVQVEIQVAANSEELRAALANGTANLAHAAVDNAVALEEKTHLGVAVVLGGEGSSNELIAQPDIASVESLRGRTLIVDAPTTAYAIQLKKILLLQGLQAGRDYEIKPIGGTPLRLAAMREHKEYAASILGPPTSLIAKHDGFVSLGNTPHFLGPYQGAGAFVIRSWAMQNRDALTSYLAAFVEAQRWLLNPANKPAVISLVEKEFQLSEPLAKQAYDSWLFGPGGFEPDASLDLDGFRNVLNLRAEIEHTWTGSTPSPETYYDPWYFNAALSELSAPK